MNDEKKTRRQLIDELRGLRHSLAEMETFKQGVGQPPTKGATLTKASRQHVTGSERREKIRSTDQRQRMATALKESEDRWKFALEGAGDGLWDWNVAAGRVYFSPQWKAMLGYADDGIGYSFAEWDSRVHPEDKAAAHAAIERCFRRESQIYRNEHRLLCKEGSYKWILARGKVIAWTEDGNPRRIIGTHADITERKRAESALKESEENFRSLFDTVEDMIIVSAPDGKIRYTNPAMTQKLGYRPDELKNMHFLDIHPPQTRNEAEMILSAMLKGVQDVCPLPVQNKTGTLIPVESRIWFGKWSGEDSILGMCKDLTKEQEAVQKFNRFFNNNPTPMAVNTFHEKRFTDVNEAFLDILGYSRPEVIGKTSAELALFVETEKQKEVAERLQTDGRIANCELKIKCKKGAILDGLFSGEIIESQGEKYLLTTMIDQTARKRAEEELAEHRRHLEDIVQERTVELESQRRSLYEMNITLKVLLKQREEDKADMEERFVLNVRNLVLPYVEQMKKERLDARQRSYLDIIEAHLREITTPLLKNMRQFNLTSKEIKVATLVRQGKSTKDIAEIMGIAGGSIEVHRKNIRGKLGLNNKKINLHAHLESLEY